MIRIDPIELAAARLGSRAALEAIIVGIERPIFNLALRMLAHRPDAEDATQEILIRIVTHLGAIREPEAAGAWAFRTACRYLVAERKRSRIEELRMSFDDFAADLAAGQSEIDDAGLTPIEADIAIKEVKVGCTLAMLTCLSRTLRISYLLGDVLELTDAEAAAALDVSAATHRQRLHRARSQVTEFLRNRCGLTGKENACSCERRVAPAIALKRIERGSSSLGLDPAATLHPHQIKAEIAKLEATRAAAALMRSNPQLDSGLASLAADVVRNSG